MSAETCEIEKLDERIYILCTKKQKEQWQAEFPHRALGSTIRGLMDAAVFNRTNAANTKRRKKLKPLKGTP